MHTTTLRRASSTLAGLGLAAAALVAGAPSATAAPAFNDAKTSLSPFASYLSDGGTCTTVGSIGPTTVVPVVENGATASATASSSATFANTAVPADTGSWSSSTVATGRVTSAGGNPDTLDFSATTNYSLVNNSTTCSRGGLSGLALGFEFTVTRPGFLHLDMRNSDKHLFAAVYIEGQADGSVDSPYVDYSGRGLKFNDTSRVYLPAGTYTGHVEGEGRVDQLASVSGTARTTVHAEFEVAGSQTIAATGKGAKYVSLPSARSCGAGTLSPSVTGQKRVAAKIKTVKVFVDDRLVETVKKPRRKAALTVPVAADEAADVTAAVTLQPKKKGARTKVVQVSASYEACIG